MTHDIRLVFIGHREDAMKYARENLPGVTETEVIVAQRVETVTRFTLPENCHIIVQLNKGEPALGNAYEIFAAASARRARKTGA